MAGQQVKGVLKVDVDTVLTEGKWSFVSGQNYNLPIDYGVLHCLEVGGGYPFMQIVYPRASYEGFWLRTYSQESRKWNNWRRLDNFGYNTLEELAAALKPLIQ